MACDLNKKNEALFKNCVNENIWDCYPRYFIKIHCCPVNRI